MVGKIFDQLPDETRVYPGHGKDTTVGDASPHLAEYTSEVASGQPPTAARMAGFVAIPRASDQPEVFELSALIASCAATARSNRSSATLPPK